MAQSATPADAAAATDPAIEGRRVAKWIMLSAVIAAVIVSVVLFGLIGQFGSSKHRPNRRGGAVSA